MSDFSFTETVKRTIAEMHDEIAALKAENAKLREDFEDQEGYDQMLRDRLRQQTELCVKAKAENAKLLELALGLHQCLDDEGCEGCPLQDDDGWCVRDIRLRELGVEVD